MKKRIADKEIYNDDAYFTKPKEAFKFIKNSLEGLKKDNSKRFFENIIDIGCANGALLHYLSKDYPEAKLIGYEPEPSLISLGKNLAPNIEFHNYGLYDIPKKETLQKGDIVIAAGVIGIFDDPKKFVFHLNELCNEGGSIFIYSPFNENDIDVILQYKPSNIDLWQTGHNLFSLTTMKMIAEEINLNFSFTSFYMPFPIEKTNDPMRSWTENFRENDNFLIYGTNMFSTMKLIRLDKLK